MKNILIGIFVLFIAGVIFIELYKSKINGEIKELKYEQLKNLEYAYFEGQRDAIEGDIRIKKIGENKYMWIKSPWDCNKKLRNIRFNPLNNIDTVRALNCK